LLCISTGQQNVRDRNQYEVVVVVVGVVVVVVVGAAVIVGERGAMN
jgi:hypothetical protein